MESATEMNFLNSLVVYDMLFNSCEFFFFFLVCGMTS